MNKRFVLVLIAMLYFFLITFVGVPPTGTRYADIVLGFLTGTLFKSFIGKNS